MKISNYDDGGFTERYIAASRAAGERLKKDLDMAFYGLLRGYRSDGLSTGAAAQAAVNALNKAIRK